MNSDVKFLEDQSLDYSLIYQDAKELIRRKIISEKDVNLFIQYVIKDEGSGNKVKQSYIHYAIQEHIDYCFKNKLLCGILAPWGHGKTAQVLGRTLFELGINNNLRVKILCNNDNTAKQRLKFLSQYIKSDKEFHDIFPRCIPAEEERWNNHELTIQKSVISKDSSIQCYGILSSGIGGRADMLIADDIVDMRNSIQQPALREQIIKTIYGLKIILQRLLIF